MNIFEVETRSRGIGTCSVCKNDYAQALRNHCSKHFFILMETLELARRQVACRCSNAKLAGHDTDCIATRIDRVLTDATEVSVESSGC